MYNAQGPRTTSSMLMVAHKNFRIDLLNLSIVVGAVTLIFTNDLFVDVDH